jgi:uncharacterized membrane protein YfcA
MDPQTIAEYLAFGLFGGIIGGLLGVGGSIGIIPLATIFISPDKQQLQGAAMITNLVVAATAYRRYSRAGQIEWTYARRILPAALVFVLVGVAVSTKVDASGFRVMFAVFLAAIAIREFMLLAGGHEHAEEHAQELTAARGGGIGFTMGFLSGLLGIGGGVVGIPLMRAWARIPMKRAVITSICTMVPLTLVGATLKSVTLWNTPLEGGGTALWPTLVIAACLAPTAIAGSWLGASINVRVTGKAVRWVLALYLPLAAVWMAWPVIARWLAGNPH